MVSSVDQVIKPTMHHVNLKTTKLQEMIDWYGLVIGAKVNFQFPIGASSQMTGPITVLPFWLCLGFMTIPISSSIVVSITLPSSTVLSQI
jgi:hypothetical protein